MLPGSLVRAGVRMLGLGGGYILRLENRPSVLLSLAKVVDDAGPAPFFVGQVA